MEGTNTIGNTAKGHFAGRRLLRSPVTWITIVAATTFLVVACSGAGGTGGLNGNETTRDGARGGSDSSNGIGSTGRATSGAADTASDFELVLFGNENNTKGDLLRLSQLEGQPVVINFWFPSCPPCRAEMPDLESNFKRHRVDGVEYIGVQLLGLDSAEGGQRFIDELGITYSVGPDENGDIIRAYKITSFPTTVFLSADHKIVRKWAGFLNAEKLEELVQEALKTEAAETE